MREEWDNQGNDLAATEKSIGSWIRMKKCSIL